VGSLIVFEGIDGSGKTTQAKMLYNALQDEGYLTTIAKIPGGSKRCKDILNVLLSDYKETLHSRTELLLFSSVISQYTSEVLYPLLKLFDVVVLDRYIASTMAYQGFGGHQLPTFSNTVIKQACFGTIPDLTILIDIPVVKAKDRLSKRGEENVFDKRGRDFFKGVELGYRSMQTGAFHMSKQWLVVDGLKPEVEIHANIVENVLAFMKLKRIH